MRLGRVAAVVEKGGEKCRAIFHGICEFVEVVAFSRCQRDWWPPASLPLFWILPFSTLLRRQTSQKIKYRHLSTYLYPPCPPTSPITPPAQWKGPFICHISPEECLSNCCRVSSGVAQHPRRYIIVKLTFTMRMPFPIHISKRVCILLRFIHTEKCHFVTLLFVRSIYCSSHSTFYCSCLKSGLLRRERWFVNATANCFLYT